MARSLVWYVIDLCDSVGLGYESDPHSLQVLSVEYPSFAMRGQT
jgi:hypothetical protein